MARVLLPLAFLSTSIEASWVSPSHRTLEQVPPSSSYNSSSKASFLSIAGAAMSTSSESSSMPHLDVSEPICQSDEVFYLNRGLTVMNRQLQQFVLGTGVGRSSAKEVAGVKLGPYIKDVFYQDKESGVAQIMIGTTSSYESAFSSYDIVFSETTSPEGAFSTAQNPSIHNIVSSSDTRYGFSRIEFKVPEGTSTVIVLAVFKCLDGETEVKTIGTVSLDPQVCNGEVGVYPRVPTIEGTCHTGGMPEHKNGKGRVYAVQGRNASASYPGGHSGTGALEQFDRPSPRYISNHLCDQPNSIPTTKGVSAHTIYLGQFIDHDITLVSEGADEGERDDIEIPEGDPQFSERHMEFHRSIPADIPSSSRTYRNTITSWLDLSSVYGSTEDRLRRLRSFKNGLMKHREVNGVHNLPLQSEIEFVRMANNPHFQTQRPYAAGDIRANEHPVLAAFHTIWLRNHNRLAVLFMQYNPSAKDQDAFDWARKVNILQWQSVVYHDWLAAVLGPKVLKNLVGEIKYDPDANADLSLEFSTSIMRFGHTGIPDTIEVHEKPTQRVADVFFRPDQLESDNMACRLMAGTLRQASEKIDLKVVNSLRNELFINNEKTMKLDLVSLNIQRARDHGIGGIDSIRATLGLPAHDKDGTGGYEAYLALTQDDVLARQIYNVYGRAHFEEVDSFVTMLSEPEYGDGILGETSAAAMAATFKGLLNADIYNFNNMVMDAPEGYVTPPGFEGKVGPLTHAQISVENCPDKSWFEGVPGVQ